MSSSDSDGSSAKANVSGGDFLNRNDKEKIKMTSTPQTSFQQLLMNTHKFNEMLQSKCKSAGVQFKKSPKSTESNSFQDFTPKASSTHVGNVLYQTTSHKRTKSKNESSDDEGEKEIKKIKSGKKLNFSNDNKKRKKTSSTSNSENEGKRRFQEDDEPSVWNRTAQKDSESSISKDSAPTIKLNRKNQNVTIKSIKKEVISNSEDEDFNPRNKSIFNANSKSKLFQKEQYEESSSVISSDDGTKRLSKNKNKSIEFVENATYSLKLDKDTAIITKIKDQTDYKKKKKSKHQNDIEEYKVLSDAKYSSSLNLHRNTKAEKQLNKFRKKHKLTKIEDKHNLLENFKSKHELYLIQIPKQLDPNKLLGTRISLQETTRVPEKSKKYDCIPTNTTPHQIQIFCNNEDISLIKCSDNLKIQRHLKTQHTQNFPFIGNQISLPENLKQRHPLFGADYEHKINLEHRIQEKLNAAVESFNKKKKKKKHKTENQEEEEIFKILTQPDPIVEKRIKKEKCMWRENVDDTDLPIKKKHKKSKHRETKLERDSSEAGVSSQNEDDSLALIDGLLSKNFEMLNTKKKKKDTNI